MRHVLTVEERIRGLRKAIDSSATPEHLKPALKRQLELLQNKRFGSQRRRKRSGPGLLDWLRL